MLWRNSFQLKQVSDPELTNWKLEKKIKKQICDTGAFLFQLDYQSNWEVITLWGRYL